MNLVGLYTLFYKEVLRFGKVLLQTLIAPVITALLYLLVFGHVFEGRVQAFDGVSYTMFLVPGLVMMSVIQNAFANSSSSLIQSKVTGNIVFMMLTPLSHLEFFLAFVLAAVVRAVLVGVGVYLVALVFTTVPVKHPGFILLFMFLSSASLGALGVIAGIWAEKFDQLAGFQNFIILPLSFLSGVFYSIHSLPEFWQTAVAPQPVLLHDRRLPLRLFRGFRRGAILQPGRGHALFGGVVRHHAHAAQERLQDA